MSNAWMSKTKTPYAVICEDHGQVFLSRLGYERQMANPNATWRCPMCAQPASWDDANYEESFDNDD